MESWLEKHLIIVANQIGNRYSIGDMIGVGSTTAAFKAVSSSGALLVLKIPRDEIAYRTWNNDNQKAFCNCERYCSEYVGPVRVVRPIEVATDYLLEPFAVGQPLTWEIYSSLCAADKRVLCSDFSKFLAYAHTQNLTKKLHPAVLDGGEISMKDSISLFQKQNAISPSEEIAFRQAVEMFESRDQSDEVACLVHGDYSASNVIYDVDNKWLSIIDFGSSCVDCIYRDFVPAFAHVSTQVSYRFFADVITEYNSLPQCTTQISVEKVALFHYLAAVHEAGLMAHCQKLDAYETRKLVASFLIPILNRISEMII